MARKPLSITEVFSSEQPYVTEFRRLLHKMRKPRNGEEETKAVLVTSAMLSEGKSTIASFLSLTSARLKGFKTLLIDADLRRPSLHKLFGLQRDRGLSEVLTEGVKPADVVKKCEVEDLHLITAGRACKKPSEVFDPIEIGVVIDEMRFYYDLIVVDCAPILPVSDPMLLAGQVDGVLLVVKAGETQKEIVQRAVDILDVNRKQVIGVVLNNVNNSLPFYYDYRYYGYEYRPEKDSEAGPKAPPRRDRRRQGTRSTTPGDKPISQP